jgi:hypothetical protein
MVASSFFNNLNNKNFKLIIKNKTNPYKFIYKDSKFSICIKNISFAYRTNQDEYRVQIGERTRLKLKEYHLDGYWALIFGHHKKSETYTAWDNKLLFSSRAQNRSLYTRKSICTKTSKTGIENYRYTDNLINQETVAVTLSAGNLHKYLHQIKTLNIHQYRSFISFKQNL